MLQQPMGPGKDGSPTIRENGVNVMYFVEQSQLDESAGLAH